MPEAVNPETPEPEPSGKSRREYLRQWRAANQERVKEHNRTNWQTQKGHRAEYRASHRDLYRDATARWRTKVNSETRKP
jgi:hypothetical protein